MALNVFEEQQHKGGFAEVRRNFIGSVAEE